MLSQEVVKGYRRNNLTPRSSSMTDIIKAFDSVELKFLFNVLMATDFQCVKCRRVSLTHLCSADDLVVFTNGPLEYLQAINSIFLRILIIFPG